MRSHKKEPHITNDIILFLGNKIIELGIAYDTPNSTLIFHRIAKKVISHLQLTYIMRNRAPPICSFHTRWLLFFCKYDEILL
jgi:hypothetical protein